MQVAHIWEYLKNLGQARTERGGYYSFISLRDRLRAIYRFHVWVIRNNLSSHQVLMREEKRKMNAWIRARKIPPDIVPNNRFWLVPECFKESFDKAVEYESLKGYHVDTVWEHQKGWILFLCWVKEQGIKDLKLLNESHILQYQFYLKKLRFDPVVNRGNPLNDMRRLRKLVALRQLFNYLVRSFVVPRDITHDIEFPKIGRGIPHLYLAAKESEKILAQIDVTTSIGVRDRAIFETFYSTGVRINELHHIRIEDVLFHEGMLRVDTPKGGKDFQRVIAISDRALYWIKKYLQQVRPLYIRKGKDYPYLFLSSVRGRPLCKDRIADMLKTYCERAGIKKKISSHCFRVGTATEMLRHGADIRFVQEQLGHTSIQSTQIYAKVLPTDLKKVHSKTHPSQRRRTVDEGVLV